MKTVIWNSSKSLTLSIVVTHIVIVVLLLLSLSLPFLHDTALFRGTYLYNDDTFLGACPFLYGSIVTALIILFTLRKLLLNIKKLNVFTRENIRLLRIISWMCYATALVLVIGSFTTATFLIMGLVAGFFGLIIRVVKNVIAAAVELKEEADYTI